MHESSAVLILPFTARREPEMEKPGENTGDAAFGWRFLTPCDLLGPPSKKAWRT